jgi:hypothetical protein
VVLILAIVFFFSPVPDIKAKDDYQIEDSGNNAAATPAPAARKVNRGLSYVLLVGNVTALFAVFGMILWLVLGGLGLGPHLVGIVSALPHPASFAITADTALLLFLGAVECLALLIAAIWLIGVTRRLTHHSIWAHEHFSGATLAQFLYVAAQSGIFSFLINYVTSEPPSLPSAWLNGGASKWVEVRTAFAGSDFKDVSSLVAKLNAKADPVSAFLATNLSSSTLETLAFYKKGTASDTSARVAIMQDLNSLILKQSIYSPERFKGITLSEKTRQLLAQDAKGRDDARLNRLLLADAYPNELAYKDGVVGVTNQFAANLASFGFLCFLIGRVSGAGLLRRASAHKVVGLYALLNVAVCLLIFFKLGWLSVVCVFLSYFFMSIMFPTIFALGIFGLGARAKGASAFIVMGIVGGALLPKLMGAVADHYDMSRGFIVPMVCFALIALYGYSWPKLSRAEALHGVGASGGH